MVCERCALNDCVNAKLPGCCPVDFREVNTQECKYFVNNDWKSIQVEFTCDNKKHSGACELQLFEFNALLRELGLFSKVKWTQIELVITEYGK